MRQWKILSAAVEQKILFPDRETYDKYIAEMKNKKFNPFEVLSESEQKDGSLIVLMRKRYNPQNKFLPDSERMLGEKPVQNLMTFRQKVAIEHPWAIREYATGGVRCCPCDYGYEPESNKPCGGKQNNRSDEICRRCWDREIPENL